MGSQHGVHFHRSIGAVDDWGGRGRRDGRGQGWACLAQRGRSFEGDQSIEGFWLQWAVQMQSLLLPGGFSTRRGNSVSGVVGHPGS